MEYTLMNQNIPTITIEIDDNGQIIKINKIHNLEYLPVGIATLKNLEKKDVKTEMLIGLGHDRIIYLGLCYIERGWITRDEYENLNDYLYKPYAKMGANGSAKRIMQEVDKLPIRKTKYTETLNKDLA